MSTGPGTTGLSPCTGVCGIEEATGLCRGCARTAEEIAVWRDAPAAFRDAVWAALPDRFRRLGLTCTRLPWDAAAIRAFVLDRLARGGGTWVMGVPGAVAEWGPAPRAAVEVAAEGERVVAATAGGRLALTLGADLRALSFAPGGDGWERAPLALVVLRERGGSSVARGLADLGPDIGALDPQARGHRLFDLGLGRKAARFCIRIPPGALADRLADLAGADLASLLRAAGAEILAHNPVRVVETALGRVEIDAPIPPPGGRSPAGPHTHLLPDHLATGRDLPPGLDIPRAYRPGVLVYP